MSASLLYVVYLIPRSEWHGGWSPPLRYIVVLMPILALGAATLWERIGSARAVITAWTMMLVIHGAAFPWRLFHIATGENFIGETLSTTWHSDFSRLMPSFIRPNFAATVGSVALVLAIAVITISTVILSRRSRVAAGGAAKDGRRMTGVPTPLVFALLLFAAFTYGRQPANRIEFEDAHVMHTGGELFPKEWTVSRFLYQGGWMVHAGDSLSFLARSGPSTLRYQSQTGATIELGGRAFVLAPTAAAYGYSHIDVSMTGRTILRCLDGSANLDWMRHD
jgi:hypothetical protein